MPASDNPTVINEHFLARLIEAYPGEDPDRTDVSLLPELLQHTALIGYPDPDPEVRRIYDLMADGHCPTCENELGRHTVVQLNAVGLVVAMYCQPQCHDDMHAVNLFGHLHQDRVEQINFRRDHGI